MVIGVVVLARSRRIAASNIAARSAVAGAGSLHRKLVIIPALLFGQNTFLIAKNHAILGIGKGSALLDEFQRLLGFHRQLTCRNNIKRGNVLGERADCNDQRREE